MKIICLVGGSGSGKDTLARELPFPRVVSYRTRPKRQGEIDGVHGHFVTEDVYHEHKAKGLVAAETVYNGHRYWSTIDQFRIVEQGIPVVYVIDWPGVERLQELFGKEKVLSIYLDVSPEELRRRMEMRGDAPELIAQRIAHFHAYDYPNRKNCDYIVSNEHTFVNTLNEVSRIILQELYKSAKEKYPTV